MRIFAGRNNYLHHATMTEFVEQLPTQLFVRIHRAAVVNVERIASLTLITNGDYTVLLTTGARLKRTARWSTRWLSFASAGILLLSAARPALAQTQADHDAVKRAAMDYIEGFYEGDTAKLVRSITPQVFKYGFDRPRDSKKYTGDVMSWAEILGYANDFKAKGRKTPATAPRDVAILDVLDQTAAAKVTAWWGTDYLLLGKFDGRWKISHVLWQSAPPKAP